jgi:hypothetical protein
MIAPIQQHLAEEMPDRPQKITCRECGKRGADVRPDFNWDKKIVGAIGYR